MNNKQLAITDHPRWSPTCLG